MNVSPKPRLALAAALVAAAIAGGCSKDDHDALSVVISLPESQIAGVAKATIEVDYSGAGASILEQDGGPACAFILPGIQGQFSDDGQGKLVIHTEGPRAARGPADIAACRMRAGDHDASAEDLRKTLTVRVTGAEDAGGKPVDLTAKAGARSRGASSRSDAEIEAEQAKAAEAVAASAPAPAPTGATGSPGAAGSPATGAVVAGQAGSGAAATPAAGAVIPRSPAASSSSSSSRPGSTPSSPRAAAMPATPVAPPVVDNSQIPGNTDRDPGYDDRDGDNPNMPTYDLVVGVTSGGLLGALQLKITHLGSSGGFVGRDGEVDCSAMVDAMMASNWPGERTAQVGLINIQGFRTPAAVVRCGFRSRESLSPESFVVEVADAADTGNDTKPVEPEPTAAVLSINRR